MTLKELNTQVLDEQLNKVKNMDLTHPAMIERITTQTNLIVNLAKQKIKIADIVLQNQKSKQNGQKSDVDELIG